MEREKGASIIRLIPDYCVIDLETTGLDPSYDRIIEVAALRVRDGNVVAQFSQLVNPGISIDPYIAMLTGITDEMVRDAPSIEDVLPDFLDFVGDDILVGHNVPFDVNFIYDNEMRISGTHFQNDHINTVRLARKLHPELSSHTLGHLVDHLHIPFAAAHRALADCQMTNDLYRKLCEEAIAKYDSADAFCSLFRKQRKQKRSAPQEHRSLQAKNISVFKETLKEQDDTHPLYGKTCVFTGRLDRMTRDVAQQLVLLMGGVPATGVTKNTNYLVLGCNDYCSSIKDGKSSKQKKAEKLRLDGADIQIISENVFYDMIFD